MFYFLLDSDFRIISGVDKFQSMIWNEKYDEIGDFELYIPATEESIKLYSEAAEKHYYIIRASDAKDTDLKNLPIQMIETVKIDTSVKNGNFLIIKGSQLKKILYRRIALEEESIGGQIKEALYSLVTNNAVSPKDPDRRIPRLICDPDNDPKLEAIGIKDMIINFTLNGEFLSKIITTACKVHHLGWDVVLDYNQGLIKFKITTGLNRTQNQPGDLSTWNSPVVFSVKNSNLIKTTYSLDYENYRNVALVKSKYEDVVKGKKETLTNIKEVKPYKIDRRPVGLDRYEIFVNGDEYELEDDNTAVDPNLIDAQSKAAGQSKLTEYLKKIDVSGEIDPGVTFKYGEDYFLGDLVCLQNEYGQTFEARITSILSTLSYNKASEIPAFVIENYTGKEEDDEEKLTGEFLRVVTITNSDTGEEEVVDRCTSDGTLRMIPKPRKFSQRIVEGGDERVASKQVYNEETEQWDTIIEPRHVIKSEYFDDDKYSAYY